VAGLLLACCAACCASALAEPSSKPAITLPFGSILARSVPVSSLPQGAAFETSADENSAHENSADENSADENSADENSVRFHTVLGARAQNTTNTPNWLTLSDQIANSAEGFDKHRLSDGRKLVGWKLSETLYFGRAKKEGATVSLVWEKAVDQRVSLSTDGIKFTRRFR